MNDVDLQAHHCLYNYIQTKLPNHNYISAHTENRTFYTNGNLWVLDPLVGISNFSLGNPHYAISVALMVDGQTQIGIIYAPALGELYTTIKGFGSFLNDQPIEVSKTKLLEQSLLSTRFPYDIHDGGEEGLAIYNELILAVDGVLSSGSAVLDLAYVAAGRLDGFWALNLNPWDLSAAFLLVEESGGKVTLPSGEMYALESKSVLGTNGNIHQSMVDFISKCIPRKKLLNFR